MIEAVIFSIVASIAVGIALPVWVLNSGKKRAARIEALEAKASAERMKASEQLKPDFVMGRDGISAIIKRDNGEVLWSGVVGASTRKADLKARAAALSEGLIRTQGKPEVAGSYEIRSGLQRNL
jgi:1-deoxy-D-xylulose 5-phosphate reductoisomerase